MHEYEGSDDPLLRQSFPKVYFTVQVTEVSLESLTRSSPNEADSAESIEELDWTISDEEDSGTASAEFGSADDSGVTAELEAGSAEDSGLTSELSPVAPVEESESLPQLAQKRLAADKQLKRKNLRIFIFPPISHKVYFFRALNILF